MTRPWCRNLVALLFALLLIAVLVLGSAAIALGAPSAQQTSDKTARWLSTTMRVPVTPRPVVVSDQMASAGMAGSDGLITLHASDLGTPEGRIVAAHELLHRPENAACWGEPGSPDRATEEGIVEALTNDLSPALLYRFHRREPAVLGWAYLDEVASVRYAVRRMTGGSGWGRPERLALRELWGADCDGRVAMLAGAR